MKGKKGFKYYLSKYEEEIDLANVAGTLVELDNEIEDVNNEIVDFCNELGIVPPFKTI